MFYNKNLTLSLTTLTRVDDFACLKVDLKCYKHLHPVFLDKDNIRTA